MGIPGVPLDKQEILEAIKKGKGIITHIAEILKCSPSTIYNRCDVDEDIKSALDEAREDLTETRLDDAERVVHYLMNQAKNDPGNALKSSIFYLNNQGKKRNYAHPTNNDQLKESVQNGVREAVKSLRERGLGKPSCESALED